MSARIGWVVDVQNDFMLPDGRLYVHDLFDAADAGASRARERIEQAVAWMREHCDALVYTGDWHAADDAEIDAVAPDAARGTYPPHCMGLSDDPEEARGAAILDSVAPEDPVVLPRGAGPEQAREVARAAVRERRPVFIHKERFSVFEGNPGAEALAGRTARAPRRAAGDRGGRRRPRRVRHPGGGRDAAARLPHRRPARRHLGPGAGSRGRHAGALGPRRKGGVAGRAAGGDGLKVKHLECWPPELNENFNARPLL